jgi:small-conductance mechanosensitive channel
MLELYKSQIIETIITCAVFIVLKYFSVYIIRLTIVRSAFKHQEQKEVVRLMNLLIVPTFIVIISSIWALQQSEILVFISSIITVIGVALFAEWSILSNITAYLVLFFSHSMKIGDRIKIDSESYSLEGEILDITYFFMYIKTAHSETITIPNAIVLKNPFSILSAH